jgi:DNA replication protein DnaC
LEPVQTQEDAMEAAERMRRPIDEADLLRMRLPERYWGANIVGVKANVEGTDLTLQDILRKYLGKLDEMFVKGYGIAMVGDNGLGKTGAAAVIAMEARRQMYSVLFLEAARIRAAVIERTPFDEHTTLMERAREVDFLVIDDLGKGTSDSKGFLQAAIDELVRARAARLAVTVLTTNMTPKRLIDTGELKKSTAAQLTEAALVVQLKGSDLRKPNAAAIRRAVLK